MKKIHMHDMIDQSKMNPFFWLVLISCSLIIIFDGYDLAVVGVALPSIIKQMGVSPTVAGYMASSALVGMMVGAIGLGMLADKIGRRLSLAIGMTLFSVFTAAAGMTHDALLFGLTRFVAGVGIGGVMPILVAHMSEYSPRKIRNTMIALMFSGYAVGGMLAAVLGKGMIENYGWQSVFFMAGIPLLMVPAILKWMPESANFLVRQGKTEELQKIAKRIDSSFESSLDDEFVNRPAKNQKSGVSDLFADGRGLSTWMIWTAAFMALFQVYGLSSWLAKLMMNAGYPLGSALNFVLALNLGAMFGAISGGWVADRLNPKIVLMMGFVTAAVSITLLGYPLSQNWLFLIVFLTGASTIGTQIVIYAYSGQFYPDEVKSSGVGWMAGIGRLGAIIAPTILGVLISRAWPLQQNFLAIAFPAVVAFVAIWLVNHSRSYGHHVK